MAVAIKAGPPCDTIAGYLKENYAKNFFDTCKYAVSFGKLILPKGQLLDRAYSSLATVTDAYYAVDTMEGMKKVYDHSNGTALENVKVTLAELFHDATETVVWLVNHKIAEVAAKVLKWLVGFSCAASIYYNTVKVIKNVKQINDKLPAAQRKKIYAELAMKVGLLVFSVFGLMKVLFACTLLAPISFALDTIILAADFYVFCRG